MASYSKLLALSSKGTRYHLKIVIALIVVLPLLALAFLSLSANQVLDGYAEFSRICIAVCALAAGVTGYIMLHGYAENVIRLREYLQNIADGTLPEKVDLLKSETDITAIEAYLNMILRQMRTRIRQLENQLSMARDMQETIRRQANEILEAERQRVMIQSLGTACHHIGQPATVLRAYLDLLRRNAGAQKEREQLDECIAATETIAGILEKLRTVSEYRPLPFRTFDSDVSRDREEDILDIGA